MITTTIERLGHLGDGIAAGPLFAARTLPGEVVEGRQDRDRLTDIRILEPSSDRVSAPCRHYGSCGGCALQHASDAFVARWKTEVVATALAGHGIDVAPRLAHVSPPRTRRRATLAARRTKKGALAGFHGRASDTIVEIPECQLLDPQLAGGSTLARDLAMIGATRKTELAVALSVSEQGLDVTVTGGKPLDGVLRGSLADVARRHDLARLTWNGETIAARRAAEQRFGAARVVPPPGAFLQATRPGEAVLVDRVLEALHGARRSADLFAGCGTFSLPLAEVSEVHAVESDAAMLSALDVGWRHAQGVKRVTTQTRDLFRDPLAVSELAEFDAVVLDPPRAGAMAQTTQLAASRVPRLAYVSCNPVTFARDAAVLVAGGYQIDRVDVIDQFRWSAHVELVARFSLAK